MGWWKTLQDTLHPPPPRRLRSPGHTPLLHSPITSQNTTPTTSRRPSADLESPWAEKPPRRRRPPSASTFLRAIIVMITLTLLAAVLSLTSTHYSPTHLLLSTQPRLATQRPPALWERFPLLTGYYNGMFSLADDSSNIPEYPPSLAAARAAADTVHRPGAVKGGGKRARSRVWSPYSPGDGGKRCGFGRVGNQTREAPEVRVFDGSPEGMPGPVFGGVAGGREEVCFERYGRLGAYGWGYSVEEGGLGEGVTGGVVESVQTGFGVGEMPLQRIDWRGVDWGVLQRECEALNRDRFDAPQERGDSLFPPAESTRPVTLPRNTPAVQKLPRTAIVLRTWSDYTYTPSTIALLRSLISELNLLSGNLYTIHLLVHVRSTAPIWSSHEAYTHTLRTSVPEEFWGISSLWNEDMMRALYPTLQNWNYRDLPLHGVYRSTFMPLQWFAQRHPEYDFFWNWEMDVRYTGHWYTLFQHLSTWASSQPRRGLWERNERFYIPEAHGSWAEFVDAVEASNPGSGIWGPVPVDGVKIQDEDPVPPFATPEEDTTWSWGVGEDVDLITLNPMFDPEGTRWLLKDDTTGYGYGPSSASSSSSPPPRGARTGPQRRSAIITASRLSRRLLARMHQENSEGHAMFSEMWPASVCLHHGLKAVFVPHATYVERAWPGKMLERVFNAGGLQSVFGGEGEANFEGGTWYYNAGFAGRLWGRWEKGEEREREVGRMCLKGMLLHPVK